MESSASLTARPRGLSLFIIIFAVVSALVWSFFVVGFFVNINSTTSDNTWGDTTWWLQPEYNFLHGRPYQHSMNRLDQSLEVGILKNPDAYININAGHTNVTNFAITLPFYAMSPNVDTLFIVVIALNYMGALFFSYKLISHLSPDARMMKTALVFALFLSSSFLGVIQYKAHATLYVGPFILAAYYLLLKKRLAWFIPTVVAIALISEDCAMFLVAFGVYVLLFEKDARRYAYWAVGVGAAWTLFVLMIVQPAARSHMVVSTGSTAAAMLIKDLPAVAATVVPRIIRLKEAFLFLPAIALVRLLLGPIALPRLKRTAGLILVAPASHWAISLLEGPGHHLMPVLACSYLSVVLLVAESPAQIQTAWTNRGVRWLTAAVAAGFILANAIVMRYDVPIYMQPSLLRTVGRQAQAADVEKDIAEIPSNRHFISVVTSIPPEMSVSYLANRTVSAFIPNRSDLWNFPEYYTEVDYVVLQKNARHAFFMPKMDQRTDLDTAIREGAWGVDFETTPREIDAIVSDLVARRHAYRVALDDHEVVVLKRLTKANIPDPPYTYGLGFLASRFPSIR